MDHDADSYRRFLEGDDRAFDEIVESLFFRLVYFVNGYLHDYHAAEDVALDAISDLFVNKKRYNFKVSLKTYLFMLGKSLALNYLKHNGIIESVPLPEDASPDETELEELNLADERSRAINAALDELPDDMKEAIRLVYFEEMRCEEAAKVMNKSKKQVYNLVFRGKDKLKTILGEEGKEYL